MNIQTGFQIMNVFRDKNLDYEEVEMVLVGNHAPFTWGKSADKAVYNSAVLESIAQMAYLTMQIDVNAPRLKESLIKKHYERKHGPKLITDNNHPAVKGPIITGKIIKQQNHPQTYMDLKKLEVWFVTGSQHLYGEEH
jgi:hypothetical protein